MLILEKWANSCKYIQYYWPMAKDKTIFTCNECGGISPKWLGKCPHCNAWNTLVESVAESSGSGKNRYSQQPILHITQFKIS